MTHKQNLLKNCYKSLPVGFVLLDNKFSVIECNKISEEACDDIIENSPAIKSSLNKYENSFYTTSGNKVVQTVMDFIIKNISNHDNSQNFSINTDTDVYEFSMSSFIFSYNTSNILKVYSVYITSQHKAQNSSIINDVSSQFNLTRREWEIVSLISKGYSNKELSEKLFLSSHTVKTHILNIFKKTGVTSRTALLYKLKTIQSNDFKC